VAPTAVAVNPVGVLGASRSGGGGSASDGSTTSCGSSAVSRLARLIAVELVVVRTMVYVPLPLINEETSRSV
jgi:hypothetical protein